ncbi:DC1 [Arabidopsis suecica]|uniref:DC1 n=1 Tax=Arabidopsis suecica TaxID=45249 RepID=A0A8T2FXP5_ARASU|nr:DC1 [Arabidopsis suecica]
MAANEEEPICRLSHPTHPHTLSRRAGRIPPSGCFACDKEEPSPCSTFHYSCTTCDVEFHDICHVYPRKLTHPYHLQHPLTLTTQNTETEIISKKAEYGYIFKNCNWCGDDSRDGSQFYRCSICNFCLDLSCSQNFPALTITNPKSHHHSLLLFPWPLLIPCEACGLVSLLEPSYACFQCNYLVHESCIDLPRVIKITRHPHRLSHTPFLPPTTPSCRVCYKTVDIKYGQYSCDHEGCSYIAHSKCATHMHVWDGRELEWEPEELDETEDIVPFKKVGDNMIKYFCHEHHLKLEKYDSVRDAKKQCQACILRIDSYDFYNCVQCDFFLHEVCAGLPRKLAHALHKHPLVLDPSPILDYSSTSCSTCARESTGFRYKCSKTDCDDEITIQIDFRCILVPDCFTDKSHEHPLFISTSYSRKGNISCDGCKDSVRDEYYLQCTICSFAMCYRCATLPYELYYKYDAHLLSLCYGEDAEKAYWCEVCEKELNPREWFYSCNKCCITIHLECIFGSSVYIKSGYTFYFGSASMKILGNNSHTRPICYKCDHRCPDSVYYKLFEKVFCSWLCVWTSDIESFDNVEKE